MLQPGWPKSVRSTGQPAFRRTGASSHGTAPLVSRSTPRPPGRAKVPPAQPAPFAQHAGGHQGRTTSQVLNHLARAWLLPLLLPAAALAQPLDRTGLRPSFAEEFTSLTASATGHVAGRPAWRTTYIGGDRTLPGNKEAEWYVDTEAFHLQDGVLNITAAPAPGLPQGMTHRSGMLSSQTLFAQRYGYFEIRAQLPRGQGMWPAFWLLPADGAWPPEIDVMEMLGHAPTTYYVAVHARPGGVALDAVTAIPAPDLSAGFHVFGLAWQAETLRFYLDDQLVHERPTPADLHRPMYLLANLAVGGAGSWPGAAPPGATGHYRIDWIRAWRHESWQ